MATVPIAIVNAAYEIRMYGGGAYAEASARVYKKFSARFFFEQLGNVDGRRVGVLFYFCSH